MTAEQALIVATDRLRRANPTGFDEFRQAFAVFAAGAMTTLVQSPAEQIFQNQGRAQALRDFARLLEECPVKAKTIVERMEKA